MATKVNPVTGALDYYEQALPSFRNKVINGAMTIDKRNSGSSVGTGSGVGVYTVDRWLAYYNQNNKFTIQQNAGSVTPPPSFKNYLGVTSSSAYTVGAAEEFSINQYIEGFNASDLDWGSSSAKTVTLSFFVRSSLTGAFGGAIRNYASNRSHPYTYTISSANTWEHKTITIVGDTSGTWEGATNTGAIIIGFGLGVGASNSETAGAWVAGNKASATGATSVVGTNGATFYITGVQFETGTSATPFEHRPIGTELSLCKRYYQKFGNLTGYGGIAGVMQVNINTQSKGAFLIPTEMRSSPSISFSNLIVTDRINFDAEVSNFAGSVTSPTGIFLNIAHAAHGTFYRPALLTVKSSNSGYLALESEL